MRSALPALLLLAACGGSAPPPQGPAPDAPDDGVAGAGVTAPAADDAQRACDTIYTLRDAGCEYLQGYDAPREECADDLRAAGDDPTTKALAGCFLASSDCATTELCVNDVMAPDPAVLSKSPSSKEAPIEVCGVQGELVWLTFAQCDDGTNPFKGDSDVAHAARVGSIGQGGRNGNIIDLYEVPCPEKTYEVFMDMYACD